MNYQQGEKKNLEAFFKNHKTPGPHLSHGSPVSPRIQEKAVSPCCCCWSANPILACQLEAKRRNHE